MHEVFFVSPVAKKVGANMVVQEDVEQFIHQTQKYKTFNNLAIAVAAMIGTAVGLIIGASIGLAVGDVPGVIIEAVAGAAVGGVSGIPVPCGMLKNS